MIRIDPQVAGFLAVGIVGLTACIIGLIWCHFHYKKFGYACYACGYYTKSQHHLDRVKTKYCPEYDNRGRIVEGKI